jgi:hypothetical protein
MERGRPARFWTKKRAGRPRSKLYRDPSGTFGTEAFSQKRLFDVLHALKEVTHKACCPRRYAGCASHHEGLPSSPSGATLASYRSRRTRNSGRGA